MKPAATRRAKSRRVLAISVWVFIAIASITVLFLALRHNDADAIAAASAFIDRGDYAHAIQELSAVRLPTNQKTVARLRETLQSEQRLDSAAWSSYSQSLGALRVATNDTNSDSVPDVVEAAVGTALLRVLQRPSVDLLAASALQAKLRAGMTKTTTALVNDLKSAAHHVRND